ncbi:lysophospholipid acyltransferase family protein [bacterium]|nr:lysophospholipid acyltransferase family protein [bacterium]
MPSPALNARLQRLTIVICSLSIIASFWLPWFRIFDRPVSGLKMLTGFSYLSEYGEALGISRWAFLSPCIVLLLGISGALSAFCLYRGSKLIPKGLVLITTILLSCALLLATHWLAWGMRFSGACGLGFWVAYASSAALFVLTSWLLLGISKQLLSEAIDLTLYIIARLLALFLRILPRKTSIALGESLAAAVFRLMPRRRSIAMRNLKIVFGDEMTDESMSRIARRSFLNLGRLAAEFARLPSLVRMSADGLFEIENLEAMKRAHGQGKGVIVLTGHFGCWELSPLGMAQAGFPPVALARPLDNHYLDRWVNRRREMAGSTIITRSSSIRELVRSLRNGKCVAVLFDQNVHKKECVFVELAGQYIASSPLPAALAKMTGASVLFAAGIPLPGGRYKIVLSDRIPTEAYSDYEEFVTINTTAYNAVFERFIREHPEAWLWVHDRWKYEQSFPGFHRKRRAKRGAS